MTGSVVPALPILYSFRRCPYAMRARLALAVSGQKCELREVVLRNKPAELLAASPKGTVPVLVLPDAAVIEESLDIMMWALQRDDPSGWLTPATGSLADMVDLITECDTRFKPALDRYKYPQRYEHEQVDPLTERERCRLWLLELEDKLKANPSSSAGATGGDSLPAGLFGAKPCLADAAIMPFVRQFAHVDRDWFDSEPWPALLAWLQAWLDSELFVVVMKRHAPWEGGVGVPFP